MSDPWDDDAPLADRLRWHVRNDYLSTPVVDDLKEAADEIDMLRAWINDEVLTGETRYDDEDGEGWQMYAGWLTRDKFPESIKWELTEQEQRLPWGREDR